MKSTLLLTTLTASALTIAIMGRAQDFDFNSLPSYQYAATKPLVGVVRIHGSQLSFHLIHLWEDAFLKIHPDIRYRDNILPSWFSGLIAGTEDIVVMGHEAWLPDLTAFEEAFGYPPLEILFATGGFDEDRRGNTPGVVFMVNRENPISQITVRQLDGILGAERTGGWNGAHWTTGAARSAGDDIRTWGQLGLTGEWVDKPITIYGTDATQSLWAGTIQRVIFRGGTKWNPAIHEMVRADHEHGPADVATVSAVARDRYAIGFGFMRYVEKEPGVKPLAVASDEGGRYVAPNMESFYRRSYPLVTGLYLYVNRPPGGPLPPRLREFIAFILSREGQQAVAKDGMYLPLTAVEAQQQSQKLD